MRHNMNYNDKINKLADLFEYKLKYGQANVEVDSSLVTLAVRPKANEALAKIKFTENLGKLVKTLIDKGARGNLIIKNFITNANLMSGKWKLNQTSGLQVSGTLMDDPKVAEQINGYIAKVNQMLIKTLELEFDRLTLGGTFKGNVITNNYTDVNGFNVDVG